MPNRWQLVEPHYHLIFLSWLPRRLRTPYLKLSGKGRWYDCEPLTMVDLECRLAKARFAYSNVCIEAVKETLRIEKKTGLVRRLVERLPDAVLSKLRPVIPTLIYVLKRGENCPGSS